MSGIFICDSIRCPAAISYPYRVSLPSVDFVVDAVDFEVVGRGGEGGGEGEGEEEFAQEG